MIQSFDTEYLTLKQEQFFLHFMVKTQRHFPIWN